MLADILERVTNSLMYHNGTTGLVGLIVFASSVLLILGYRRSEGEESFRVFVLKVTLFKAVLMIGAVMFGIALVSLFAEKNLFHW